MKIAVGINCFLERDNLKITLPQITIPERGGFDDVLVIDGRHTHFDYPSRYSDDGSHELLKKYSNVILIKKAGTQIEKRNKYMDYAKFLKYDFLLVMDADWDIKVNWKELRGELQRLKNDNYLAYNVEFNVSTQRWPFALLYKPDRVEYHKIHHVLRCRRCHFEIDTICRQTDDIKGISLRHRDRDIRSNEYKVAKTKYQAWKLQWENKLRRKRGMKEIG